MMGPEVFPAKKRTPREIFGGWKIWLIDALLQLNACKNLHHCMQQGSFTMVKDLNHLQFSSNFHLRISGLGVDPGKWKPQSYLINPPCHQQRLPPEIICQPSALLISRSAESDYPYESRHQHGAIDMPGVFSICWNFHPLSPLGKWWKILTIYFSKGFSFNSTTKKYSLPSLLHGDNTHGINGDQPPNDQGIQPVPLLGKGMCLSF